MISIIVAKDQNNLIGKDNQLPWILPEDLLFFKRNTLGKVVIMGRKTFDSLGKPLKDRKNIILTRNAFYSNKECEVMNSIQEVLEAYSNEDIFIIGGAEIIQEFIPYANTLLLTVIEHDFEGDTFLNIDLSIWNLISKNKGIKNEKNPYDYFFYKYVK